MIKIVPIEEELENNISRPYTKKQWQKFEEEAKSYIDNIFSGNSVVECIPDKNVVVGSTPTLKTNINYEN